MVDESTAIPEPEIVGEVKEKPLETEAITLDVLVENLKPVKKEEKPEEIYDLPKVEKVKTPASKSDSKLGKETKMPVSQTEEPKEIYTARSEETGDKVYAVRKGKRYWIKNPETLTKMGFYLGQEKNIPFQELLNFPEGEPLDLTIPNAIYPWNKSEDKQKEAEKPHSVWS
jgi:hypothetical protein